MSRCRKTDWGGTSIRRYRREYFPIFLTPPVPAPGLERDHIVLRGAADLRALLDDDGIPVRIVHALEPFGNKVDGDDALPSDENLFGLHRENVALPLCRFLTKGIDQAIQRGTVDADVLDLRVSAYPSPS